MKVLIIGASGYLGNVIYHKLKKNENNTVYGTCYKSITQDLIQANLLNKRDIETLVSLKPDTIIWSINDAEEEMALSQIGVNRLINSISRDVRFIYVSTTIGEGKDQAEDVVPKKRTSDEYLYKYINGKIKGEELVCEHENNVIVRPGSIYGYDTRGNMDSRMKILLELSKTNEKYSRTGNMFTSFVNVEDLAEAIIELTYIDFTGVINISGEEAVSYYDFNKYLAKLININDSFITVDYKQEPIYRNLNNDKRKQVLTTLIREIRM
ncbi:MAG: NAD(P)-dependent oxidoreductase [Vallitalea sp.]|jgi:dTDP-4-dehydrorhamnose reductase|nr:NAD(P)-dependent oxidoreductase [Vallitalea sp.]